MDDGRTDGRSTDGRRTPDHGYTISSPCEPNGSGELKKIKKNPRFGKRELICLLSFTCNYVVSVGEVSSSSGRLGWATLFFVALPGPSI